MRLPRLIAGLGLLTTPSLAILVAPGSPCASKCGNVLDKTSADDLTCDEGGYGSGAGLVFKSCLECELGSSYVTESDEFKNGKESDLQWMIYNLRYATSYCFFGYPDGEQDDTPCITSTACGPFRDAVGFAELASNTSTYDYCAEWQHSQMSKCLSCIRPEKKDIMNNFFTVLNAACEQQPLPGTRLGIEGSVFSSDVVNISESAAVPTLDASYFDEGPFGLGAKVGVSLGALGFVLAVAGILIVCLGKRRRRAYLRQIEKPAAGAARGWAGHVRGQPSETPLSQKPLRGAGWDDSPVSAATEKGAFPGRYFSPYSSQFSSPVSAVDAPAMQWPDLSDARGREIGLALGGDSPRVGPPSPAKGKGRAWEWDGVEERGGEAGPSEPPVLGHPGYGRSSGSPPRRYTLTEEDARKGDAI